MTPFAAVVGGGLSGFFGAALAHALTTLAGRAGASEWLRGPYGPPFFGAALYTGIFYAAIAAAAGRKASATAVGFLGTFMGILLPMFVLTRYGGWGAVQWQYAAAIVYSLSIWGTIAAIGAASASGKKWRGAAAAVLGSLAGYAVLAILLKFFAGWAQSRWNPASLIPSPVNLLDGLLSGAGLCLALALEKSLSRRTP